MQYYFDEKIKEIKPLYSKVISNLFAKRMIRSSIVQDFFIIANRDFIKSINIELEEKLKKSKKENVFIINDPVYWINVDKIHKLIKEEIRTLSADIIRDISLKELIYEQLKIEIENSIEGWNNICEHAGSPLTDLLLNSTENDYIDFKKEWYKKDEREKLIHDIVSLSNSISDSKERYIFIGVKEDSKTKKKEYFGVENDTNVLKAEDIVQILRNYMQAIPKIEIQRIEYNSHKIDIIKIEPIYRDLPHVLNNIYKLKSLHKNFIYSRNSGQNTPADESCEKEILKELFARQKSEHLSAIDRFKMYLDDVEKWKYTTSDKINTYYYEDNFRFKIVRKDYGENIRYFNKIDSYREILVDTGICLDYWKQKDQNYNDHYAWFNVELWAENTLIDTYSIMEFFAKHFFSNNGIYEDTYYLPTRDYLAMNNMKSKEVIEPTFIWKICRVLYKNNLSDEIAFEDANCSQILNFLNYEFLQKSSEYIEDNKDWIYG